MSNKRIEELIVGFIEGNCHETEIRELLDWITDSPENRDILFGMKDIYDRARFAANMTDEQIESGWNRLAAECGIDRPGAPGRAPRNRRIKTLHRLPRRIGIAAACVAAIAAGAVLLPRWLDKPVTFTADDSGTHTQITLPDGSNVWLYDGAVVEYSKNRRGPRNVLLAGEAFFDVASDGTTGFVVSAGPARVEVLGTRFNVSTSDEITRIVLESGSLGVNRIEKGKIIDKAILRTGEMAVVETLSKKISVSHVDTQLYTSWKERFLNIKSLPLDTVMKMLAKRYNTKIRVNGAGLKSEIFTGRIDQSQSLAEIFEVLSITTPINYRFIDDTWILTTEQ